mmetsp:Transcript_9134/g.29019  ORF Transcript_9134/g.29019 Transcript_9134/m.29019 type:complete len:420 (+) Transcript_9134:54-1313(+)
MASNVDSLEDVMEAMDVEPVLADDDGEMLIEEEDDEALPDEEEEEEEEEEDAAKESAVVDESAARLGSHEDAVYAVAIRGLEDGRYAVVTGGGDDMGRLSIVGSKGVEASADLLGHSDSVTCVGFSHTGAMVATGSYDGTVRLWDGATGEALRTLEGPGDVEWLRWHPRGEVVLAGAQDGTCWMWLATTGECLRVFVGHDGPVTCGTFTTDGNWIATGSVDGTVKVWGPKKGICRHTFVFDAPVTSLESHPTDADVLIAAAEDGKARLVHRKTQKVLSTLEHSSRADDEAAMVTAAALFGGGAPWAATGGVDAVCHIWDLGGASPVARHAAKLLAPVVALSWHPREPRLYAAAADGKTYAIDARSGQTLLDFSGHTDAILALAVDYGPDRDVLVTAGDDRVPRVFRAGLADGGVLAKLS